MEAILPTFPSPKLELTTLREGALFSVPIFISERGVKGTLAII